jgi:hypothetical protein
MKNLLILIALTFALSLCNNHETYITTSKVSLYENNKLVRVAWYEGTKFYSKSKCLKYLHTDNSRFKLIETQLNNNLRYNESIKFSESQCISLYDLELNILLAKHLNSK